MEEKATQEFLRGQLLSLRETAGRVVSVMKADHPLADKHQARIGDRHAVDVATEVLQDLLRAAKRRAGVDHPGASLHLSEERLPRRLRRQCGTVPSEVEPVLGPQPAQPREVFAPEDLAEGLDGKQVAGMAGPPLHALSGQSTPRHDAVHVDMFGQGLAPGMEDGGDPELGSYM